MVSFSRVNVKPCSSLYGGGRAVHLVDSYPAKCWDPRDGANNEYAYSFLYLVIVLRSKIPHLG